jgi:UDP-glucose 4-epimerase
MNSLAKSKVVVLGSTGFVGSALLKHLQTTQSGPVSGLHTRDLDLLSPQASNALGEILDDQTTLIVACRSPRHLEPFNAYDHEIAMTRNIARCLASNSLRKCLFLSTVSVYDDTVSQANITEMTPIQPASLYGVAKLAGENLLSWAGKQTGTPVTVFRLCKTFGNHPGSLDYGPNSFIRSAMAEEVLDLYGDGSELRDHLFIEDLLTLVDRYVMEDFSGTFNVVSGGSHSFRQTVDWVQEYTSQNLRLQNLQRTRPKVDQSFQNDAILSRVPGFRFTKMKRAIEKTVKFYSESGAPKLKGIS